MTAKTYGGAVKSKVSTVLYFKVATTVLIIVSCELFKTQRTHGKKFVTVPEATIPKRRTIRTYVLMSEKASFNPTLKD